MKKNNALRRAAALMAALSITVSLAAPAFAGTYYIDNGDITITKKDDGSQEIKQNGTIIENDDRGEIVITTHKKAITSLESDLEGPAAEDSGFGPVVEDNYQPAPPAQPEDAEEPKDADQPESAEEPKDADQPENTDRQESAEEQESAGQQAQPQQAAPAAAPAASTPKNDKGNGFWGNTITVINNFADTVLNLTLKDVKIDVSDTGNYTEIPGTIVKGKAALSVQGDGSVEIELDGKNELKSGFGRAGLEKNTSEGTLTLKDDNKDGSLKATGGDYGAGIGGGYKGNGKNITITSGTVTVTGGFNGAGIGGGEGGNGKNITINRGTVTAAGDYGAGIGGGAEGGGGNNITIKGGTVTATGGGNRGNSGAGIGGGSSGSGENITINDGKVTATGGNYAAGIGGGSVGRWGGDAGSGKNITINGGTVNATGDGGAGIGGGGAAASDIELWGSNGGNGEDITINGGTVNAAGAYGGAGIGGGLNGIGSKVTVSGAAHVTATATASRDPDWPHTDTGATIGNGSTRTPDGESVDGKEIQADISGLTTGWIHHIIYNPLLNWDDEPDTILKEWWEFALPKPPKEDKGFNVDALKGTPEPTLDLHVETLKGVPLPFNTRQQGSTLRVTTDNLAARLHGTRHALEALQEHGVEQIEFVTTFKTTTLSVADLLAEGGSWFALEHDGFVSRQLSAAQAESLKCELHS